MAGRENRQEIARRGERIRGNSTSSHVFVIRQNFDWYDLLAKHLEHPATSAPKLNAEGFVYYVVSDEDGELDESPPWFIRSPGFLSEGAAMAWAGDQSAGRIYWSKTSCRRRPRGFAFVSYMREDAAAVDEIANLLRSQNIRFWLDRHSIGAGELWESAIREAIDRGAVFLACFSRHFDERI